MTLAFMHFCVLEIKMLEEENVTIKKQSKIMIVSQQWQHVCFIAE